MHIKQVTIQGFRSYRDSTACEVFSPHHNIVVGRNGSGKSNFFSAIQFVLSDDYSNLRTEQRTALLHEGTGPRVISAFVELLFDNADKRLPITKDEVSLRRVIGQKKDQYFIDKKIVTKKDVVQLLEAAGFSRSNPYYIVKQGKINEMATQQEPERLKLLKEVAGTRVYDDKRAESMDLIKKTNDSRSKVNSLLTQIVDKLESLEEEKEELTQYQKHDKERRAFEYLLHASELREAERKLQQCKDQRDTNRQLKQEMRQSAELVSKQVVESEQKLSDLDHRLSRSKDEKEAASVEKDKILHQKTRNELEVNDLKISVSDDRDSKVTAAEEHENLRRKIREKKEELERMKPDYEQLLRTEREIEREMARAERRRDELYAKQGRNSRFHDQNSRDSWIKCEIEKLQSHIRRHQQDLQREQDDIERVRKENSDRNNAISQCRAEMQIHKGKWDKQNDKALQLKREKEDILVKQNELWRNETKLIADKQQLSTELRNKESQLQGMIGRSTLNGINAINEVKKKFEQQGKQELVDGYLGTLIESFSTEQSFFTAVEVTAGGRLFNHVVTSSSIGNAYLVEMNRMKLQGEVTFLPLDRLQARREQYPRASDALPLIDKIEYEESFSIVMLYVFGKTLICRNIEVATRFARQHGFDCITLDGDQVSRRGALTGGYIDTTRSKLELHHTKQRLKDDINEQANECQRNRDSLKEFDDEMNKLNREIQNIETELNKCKELYDRHSQMFANKTEEYRQYLKSIEERENHMNNLSNQMESLESDKHGMEEELGTSMVSQLTPTEQEEIKTIVDHIQEKNKQLEQKVNERTDCEKRKNRIETLLSDNLCKREEELKRNMDQLDGAERRAKLTECQDQFERIAAQLEDCVQREGDLYEEIRSLEVEHANMKRLVDENNRKQSQFQQELKDADKDADKMASKESIYLEKQTEAGKKIRDLGAVPNDLIEKYDHYTTKNLYKKLDDANRALKKYGHVNKKALDQFMSFSEERSRLERRRDELNGEAEKIEELVRYLDAKKYETIEYTFRKISKNFEEVFKKLVPGGHARLEMKEYKNKDPETTSKVERLEGILIKVSFSGVAAETREMSQLSGGQKSMVALTLIFAIQKCDPVPFYLFDEIDQALDPAHRRAVSQMMNEMKKHAQFITTTFRPELLDAGDKFYGVIYRNKVSHVNTITKAEALDFVEDDKINN